jgi:thioredoxin-dependent peroxiredoxin
MTESDSLLAVGSQAPDFSALTSEGERVSLGDFRGSKSVLLMFYPKDDTPGCTKQMCAARDERGVYDEAGVERFGVNPGSLASHQKFASKYSLDFPLLVDEGGAMADAYGVRKENGGVKRATYVIDPQGRIAYAAPGAKSAGEILEAIGG